MDGLYTKICFSHGPTVLVQKSFIKLLIFYTLLWPVYGESSHHRDSTGTERHKHQTLRGFVDGGLNVTINDIYRTTVMLHKRKFKLSYTTA